MARFPCPTTAHGFFFRLQGVQQEVPSRQLQESAAHCNIKQETHFKKSDMYHRLTQLNDDPDCKTRNENEDQGEHGSTKLMHVSQARCAHVVCTCQVRSLNSFGDECRFDLMSLNVCAWQHTNETLSESHLMEMTLISP